MTGREDEDLLYLFYFRNELKSDQHVLFSEKKINSEIFLTASRGT